MLANGITFGYKEGEAATFTILDTLKKVPDFGIDPEMVENTPLNAANKQYEIGVGDLGDLEYTFKYVDNAADSETRKLLELADEGKAVAWEHAYPDGTKYNFSGIPTTKIIGGELNSPVELVVKIAVTTDIDRVDPA